MPASTGFKKQEQGDGQGVPGSCGIPGYIWRPCFKQSKTKKSIRKKNSRGLERWAVKALAVLPRDSGSIPSTQPSQLCVIPVVGDLIQ